MRIYSVKVTPDARADLKRYLRYIKNNLNNPQAVRTVAQDFRDTKNKLKTVAGSIAEPESEKLKKRGLRRINFQRHEYFLLYRISDDIVEITNMFHGSEDFENKLR